MDWNPTHLPLRLLVNAEPFGFGPSAAIADFFPFLRPVFSHIAFAGEGHSLDLHRGFDYDDVIDLSEQGDGFNELLGQYDLFLTAMDISRAEQAVLAGVPTIFYDALTWFWPELPSVFSRVFYLAQGFHGVRERLDQHSASLGELAMVPPLTPKGFRHEFRPLALLNMGGLLNPFWDPETCDVYAEAMVLAVRRALDPSLSLRILGSTKVAQRLPHLGIETLDRREVEALLPKTQVAFMTPGLANIYEAAANEVPTVFLPPANDSQGQQLDLLRAHGQVDAYVDWDRSFDYRGDQKWVMTQIAEQIQSLRSPQGFQVLCDRITEGLERLTHTEGRCLRRVLEQYGCNGAEQVSELIRAKAQRVLQGKVAYV